MVKSCDYNRLTAKYYDYPNDNIYDTIENYKQYVYITLASSLLSGLTHTHSHSQGLYVTRS